MQTSNHVYWIFQVREVETVTTYDSSIQESIIDTPCESAQKYWIRDAALVILLEGFFLLNLWWVFTFCLKHQMPIISQSWMMECNVSVCCYDAYNLLLYMQHATHTIVFSHLLINGRNDSVHVFVCQIWDENGHAQVANWIHVHFPAYLWVVLM